MGTTREDVILRIRTQGVNQYTRTMEGMRKTVTKMKFEWLGVMFAGMALQRVFGGLVRAQLDLFGVTEMMSAAWTTVLLPVMDLIVPVLMNLIDLFMNMPEGMQMAVGVAVVVAAIFGTILAVVGQLYLGISSLAIIFGTTFSYMAASIAGIFFLFIGLGLLIAGIVMAVVNWGKDWGKVFKGIGIALAGLAIILGVVFGLIPALIAAAVAALAFLISWMMQKFPSIGDFFQKWFYEKPKEWIGKLWDYVKRFFSWIGDKIGGVFNFVGGLVGLGGSGDGLLGSFQTGGIIPQTGPYLMHEGETVIPTGQSGTGMSPNINITANVSSDYDVRRLADQLKKYWVSDFEGASKGRAV